MKINTRKEGNVTVLDLEGNIDINCSDLIEAVGKALSEKMKGILCNFEEVNLIDYIGISALAIMYKNVINHRARIKFYNIPVHVQKIFSLVGLDKVLESYATEEQALNSFEEDAVIEQLMGQKMRRRFQRIPFKSPVEYCLKFSSKQIFFRGKALNLSAVGAFIVGEKTFSVGDTLTLKLHLLPRPGIIEVEGRIVWISEAGEALAYSAMGVEFLDISSQKQEQIAEYVEKKLA